MDIGLSFFVELTIEEALEFCHKKELNLDSQVAQLDQQISQVKAKIKLVTEVCQGVSMCVKCV